LVEPEEKKVPKQIAQSPKYSDKVIDKEKIIEAVRSARAITDQKLMRISPRIGKGLKHKSKAKRHSSIRPATAKDEEKKPVQRQPRADM
jgi:hypothetical protein